MGFTYDEIWDFFMNKENGYYKTYNTLGQDPKTKHSMDKFYSPEAQLSIYFFLNQ